MNMLNTCTESAALLSISLSTLLRLIKSGQIPPVRIGKRRMIRSADLLKFAQIGTPNTGRPQNGLVPTMAQRLQKSKGYNSAMSLYKRGSVWWSRILVNGFAVQRSTRCRAKKHALVVEGAWRVAEAKGQVGLFGTSKSTLLKFGEKFKAYLPAHVAKRTAGFYTDAWAPLTKFAPLASAQLSRIDASLVEQFTQHRLAEGVLPATVNGNLRTLRRALKLAEEWKLIHRAPKVKLLPGERMREFVITEELLSKILKRSGPTMQRLLPFLLDTGLRISEACALTWDTVSLEPKEGAERGWVYVAKGKSKYAKRYVPLTARAAEALRQQKAVSRSQWVWGSADGKRKATRWWPAEQFRYVRDDLGLPWDCVLHSTRHTFCTRLGESGVDAFTIQKLAGHSSIVISQRYVHPTPARLEHAIDMLQVSTNLSTAAAGQNVSD